MHIDIYSDLVCPWCFIGKRRLDRVLSGEVGEGVTLRWRPYQLYPHMPVDGVNRTEYLRSRYGADADLAKIPTRIRDEAASESIELNYGAMQRMPNTLKGHYLMTFAGTDPARQHALADQLFRDYFQLGRDVGDPQVLLEAAAAVGFSVADAQAAFNDQSIADEVRTELEGAPDKGITGVPCFMLGGTFALPGVQSDDVIVQFITRAKERLPAQAPAQ